MDGPGGLDSQATWRALLAGHFFTVRDEGIEKCPMCGSKEACNNYFCLKCAVGGVCPATFHAGGDHSHHPWIRVYKVTHECALREDDLTKFVDRAKVQQMQKYRENQKIHYKFFRPIPRARKSTKSTSFDGRARRGECQVCGYTHTSSKPIPNSSDTPVCSMECLLDQAERNPENGLVTLVLGAEDGNMDPPRAYKTAAGSSNNDGREEQRRPVQSGRQRQRKQSKECIVRSESRQFVALKK